MSYQSFGLYALADLKLRRHHTNAIFQTIIDIPPKESSEGRTTRKDIFHQRIHDMLSNGPKYFNLENVGTKIINRGQTPIDICYKQEIERMQHVLKLFVEVQSYSFHQQEQIQHLLLNAQRKNAKRI
jgi:hypothetical protein